MLARSVTRAAPPHSPERHRTTAVPYLLCILKQMLSLRDFAGERKKDGRLVVDRLVPLHCVVLVLFRSREHGKPFPDLLDLLNLLDRGHRRRRI